MPINNEADMGTIKVILGYLERHGVDCSRVSNEGDAIVLGTTILLAVVLALFMVSPFFAGLVAGMVVLRLLQYFNIKRKAGKLAGGVR